MESFADSFNQVYGLHPQELQLGFLKVLKGSPLYRETEKYGIIYRSRPPYEVLQTKWMTCEELLKLKRSRRFWKFTTTAVSTVLQ